MISYSAFDFLSHEPKRIRQPTNNLAWINAQFHFTGNNYYIYTCHNCQSKQIKKGQQPKEVLNWGGNYV